MVNNAKMTRRGFLGVLTAAAVSTTLPSISAEVHSGIRKVYTPRAPKPFEMHMVIVDSTKMWEHNPATIHEMEPYAFLAELSKLDQSGSIDYYGIMTPDKVVGVKTWDIKGSDICGVYESKVLLSYRIDPTTGNIKIHRPVVITCERNVTVNYEVKQA
ncbi:hypothetical protein GR7B_00229 [Vibrio phage vB_VcorM_GR7B]|nr:hypothetical protein GR7B_00229 [Vibrio phage vB_VcorM_GR7B]